MGAAAPPWWGVGGEEVLKCEWNGPHSGGDTGKHRHSGFCSHTGRLEAVLLTEGCP